MPGHRYQRNDRAGDDTGDPWLRRGCGLGSGWADSGHQPSIDPWLAGLPPLRVRSGRMSTPAAGTGWARRTPGQGPGRLCGGRWRLRGEGRQAPHSPTDAGVSTARSGWRNGRVTQGRESGVGPARSLPGCPGQRRWAWDVHRCAPRVGQPAPQWAPDGPAEPPGHGPGGLCGGRWRLRGKGRQAPHSPTDAGVSTALSVAGRPGIVPVRHDAPAGGTAVSPRGRASGVGAGPKPAWLPGSTPMGLGCAPVRTQSRATGSTVGSGWARRTLRAWPWETVWGALATPGKRPPSPTQSHRRRCVHRPVGRRRCLPGAGIRSRRRPEACRPGCSERIPRRRAWDVHRCVPRAGQPAPRRGPDRPAPPNPQGMALGDCVWGVLATPGEKPPSPTQPHRRRCVHRPVGRWTARNCAGAA